MRPKRPSCTQLGRLQPEPRREEHAIARRRRAAALNVPEDGDTRLEPRSLLDLSRERVADAAEDEVAELVGCPRVVGDEPTLARLVRELVALAHDDDREVLPSLVSLDELLARALDGDRLLGDENHVRATRNPAHDRNPARVSAHDLDDHHAVVRLAAVCSRSIASVAIVIARSKPNV